nr:DUF6443 domain-containing protein [Parabacteroides pacaensis]
MKKNTLLRHLPCLLLVFFSLSAGILPGRSQQAGTNNTVNRHILNEAGTQSVVAIQYYDVLGRPYQEVKKAYTPTGKDLITYRNLDIRGRTLNESVPVAAPATGNPLSWGNVQSLSQTQYGDASAYSDITYESSGLDRPLTSYGPGASWKTAGKSIRQEYTTNVSGDAQLNAVCFIAEGQSTLRKTGNYETGSLFVTKTTGEDNEVSYEFQNKNGHTVLTRQISEGIAHDTYYVWNELGFLVYVLPPLASDGLTAATTYQPSNEILQKYAYYYEYDGFQQLQAVRFPGSETVYNIYDKGGRLALKQDGAQRTRNEWSYYVYDAMGRLAEEGICTSTQSLENLRTTLAGIYMKVTPAASTSGYNTASVLPAALSGRSFRKSIFYDTYAFRSQVGFGNTLPAGSIVPKGKPAGSIVLLEGNNQLLRTVIHYDSKGRESKQISENHLGGLDTKETTYTFTDQPLKEVYTHTATGKSTLTQQYDYTYDSSGRLTKTTHRLNDASPVTLSTLTYDEYDRLANKKLHGTTESTTYSYNVRSWTTAITSPHFTQTLSYNIGTSPLYNGNIRSMTWKSGTESTERGYTFSYNGLNFLTSATYGEGSGLSTNPGRFTESQTYDKHGNILTQQRYGKQTSGYGVIDNLTLTYSGNQLLKVTDAAAAYPEEFNFVDGSNEATEYLYDGNGRTITDKNAGISTIRYYPSERPSLVQFAYGHQTAYLYDADGVKRQVKHLTASENQQVLPGQTVTLPAGKIASTLTTDYCGNMIYENGALKQILTPEGYITLSGSTPTYHYYLRDHQGNNRVVINQNSTVEQVTHYYPFGMTYGEGTSPDVQPYKYNGKELDRTHGLNWYDYEARMYAGYRFPIPDPLADKYPAISPYAYCANNPVLFIDPKGEKIVIGTPLGHFWGYFGINTYESKVQKQIVYLKSLNPELKTTIEYLEKSEMIVRIHEIPILQKNKGNYTQVKIDKSNKILSLEIGYNPDSHTTNQKHDRPPVVGLMHELGHAESYLNGKGVLYNSENAKYGIGIDVDKGNLNEYNAITKENIVRKILGIKERSYEYYKRKNEIK